jgi:hypothetical protein
MTHVMHVTAITVTNDAGGNPIQVLINGTGTDLHRVTYKVGDPATGVCHHGAPAYSANVFSTQANLQAFIAYYNAHPTTTNVTVTCGTIPVTMAWGS